MPGRSLNSRGRRNLKKLDSCLRENDARFDIRLNVSRLFRYQTLLGILSPIVAVMLAFVVGGIIILVFIKSFVFTPAVFVELQGKGVSA